MCGYKKGALLVTGKGGMGQLPFNTMHLTGILNDRVTDRGHIVLKKVEN